MAQIVTLYQSGVLKELPDLPIPFVDSDRVDASPLCLQPVKHSKWAADDD